MTDPMHSTSLIFTPDEAATSWIRYAEFIRTEPGLTWGVERIDRTILPLRRGKILGIIARPGHGKSSLAVYLARREAQTIVLNGRKEMVFYVTLDQPVEEIETVMQSESGISVSDIAWGRADLEVMRAKAIKRVHLPLAYVGKSAIEYRRTAPFTFRNIYTEITNEARRLGVRVSLIVIDYIQKFHVGEREQRNDQVTEAIFAARELALDLQCKMIVCVQAAREVDRDGDKLPRAHHCQHASAIEQEADALVGLWRPIKTETAREVTVNIGGQKYLLPITPELLLMRLDKQRGEAAGINYALHFSPQLVSLAELEL